jgi:hypothetical protein
MDKRSIKCKGDICWNSDNAITLSIVDVDDDDDHAGSEHMIEFSRNPLEMALRLEAAAAWLRKNRDEAIDANID